MNLMTDIVIQCLSENVTCFLNITKLNQTKSNQIESQIQREMNRELLHTKIFVRHIAAVVVLHSLTNFMQNSIQSYIFVN